jgi:omega-6 fatty acid desaturase (delta-12 desaturase)
LGQLHSFDEDSQNDSKNDTNDLTHSSGVRVGKDLLRATQVFAVESVAKSWWYVGSTLTLVIASLVGAGMAPWLPVRIVLSILAGLLIVRAFITYHDYMHGAILRDSRLAKFLFSIFAAFALTPSRSWRKSHNYHHGHVGQISKASIGAFPVMTTKMWQQASAAERAKYRFIRHPMVVFLGYITIFLFGITLLPLFSDPKKYWDSALAIIFHFGLLATLWVTGGFDVAFFVLLLPMSIASALGSYLFFAQHSFKRMHIISPEAWNYYRAALESSSYMQLNRLMQWFTGNIGYHHIHHLNVSIPFYRLPEAMSAIPELQTPVTTTLSLRAMIDCFKSSLWDEEKQRMVPYREAFK